MSGRPFIAIVGPTAAGKTELALSLCERLDGEVLSCDALQIRAGLPLLTAKPSAAEQARARHHLIDRLPIDQAASAAQYAQLADEVIADLQRRGKAVILCGGTGLYLRALVQGLFQGPPADPGFRAALRAEAARAGLPALHQRLAQVDPEAARRIMPTDYLRVERALEVFEKTGRPISALQAEGRRAGPRYAVRVLGLDPGPAALRARIAQRARRMIEQGVVAEVDEVRRRFAALPYPPLGYDAVCQHLRGALSEAELAEELTQRTAQYARRQRTWFRKEPGLTWVQGAGAALAALQEGTGND